MKGPFTGPFFSRRVWLRMRSLFDRRSGEAACLVAKRQSHPLRQKNERPLYGAFFFSPSVVADKIPVRPTQPRSGMLAVSSRSERVESLSLRQNVKGPIRGLLPFRRAWSRTFWVIDLPHFPDISAGLPRALATRQHLLALLEDTSRSSPERPRERYLQRS